MEQLDVNKLRNEFNRASQSVRLVSLFSPTCTVCQYGQGIVRGIFEVFGGYNLKGFVVWVPMMSGDNVQFAGVEAETFKELPVVHTWDPECRLGELYARTLKLRASAWDVYLLYAPGVRWDGNEPPQPTFWMHQLTGEIGARLEDSSEPDYSFPGAHEAFGERRSARPCRPWFSVARQGPHEFGEGKGSIHA